AGTTLLSYFEVGREIDFLVDDNTAKHNKYSPGDQIKVFPVSEIYNTKPDYILILAWLYTDKIVKNHRKFIEKGGKFISILPELKVIS
ncbi:MAG: class I SAM-dependent methyltransferase, partial [SAR202 cluster bacterium]|nr:class I SAM-dependent methyltransferase [SAR202 cluster bacterium]